MNDVTRQRFSTHRLTIEALVTGPPTGAPVVFVHGNLATSTFWESTLESLSGDRFGVAPDLRSFGGTDSEPVDATRGLRDWSDDLHALVDELEPTRKGAMLDLVGWSMGGGIAMQYTIDHPERVGSLILVAPLSPKGFGGTRDLDGTPCWPDFAGSGGGTAAAEYVERLAAGDRSEESDFSPRKLMNTFYFRPSFRVSPELEERLLDSVLSTRVGRGGYPGEGLPSENWPGSRPGPSGVNNAMSPQYCDLGELADINPKPDVLWLRGADDQVISDTSMFDFGHLGALGAAAGWPGPNVYPPQPMLAQTRALLDRYAGGGGRVTEVVLEACGHTPQIEQPNAFRQALDSFLVRRR